MLKLPAFRSFKNPDVVAYQDDTQFWKFYLIPGNVSIRKDANGHPVFLLVKYAFSDQDRAENHNLPRGGGFLVFDTELSVADEVLTRIKQQLQEDVNNTWNQLKAIAEAHGGSVQGAGLSAFHNLGGPTVSSSLQVDDVLLGLGPDRPEAPPGDAPPKVVIADPTYTQGTFHIQAPQTENLISKRIAEGPVSLTGSNVVSANMDLTPAGATFMERTLTNADGTGGTDLAPIQAVYQLKFWARVPPVRISVSADSRSLGMAVQSIYHDYQDNGCDEDTMRQSEQRLDMAVNSGLIKVRIDAGTLQLGDDFVKELRSSALKIVMDQIKQDFFDKKPPPPPPPADDPTKDFVKSDNQIYYMKTDLHYESMHFEYSEELQNIVEWPANPQGTLQTFLAGVSPQEMKKYVRTINLDDPFFKTLGLTATAFADWANDPIAFAEVQVRYTGNDENGQPIEKVQTFTFTKDKQTDAWDPSLINGKREYQYRWRVAFQGMQAGPFSQWQTDTTPKLNLSLAKAGKIDLPVLAGSINFKDITKLVQVELKYSDQAAGVPEQGTTVVLTTTAQSVNYTRLLGVPWNQPVQYRTRFFLKNDQQVQSDWQSTTSRQLVVNEPDSINKLDVQIVPSGDWGNVQQAVVNVKYADPANSVFGDAAFDLTGLDQFQTWFLLVKDPNLRKFQYKILATFKDGSPPFQTNWQNADGDQALTVALKGPPRLKVGLSPALLDFKATPVVTATLHYDDAQGNVHKVDTFAFTANAAADVRWDFPITNDAQRTYRRTVTYNLSDARVVQRPEEQTDETVFAIPNPEGQFLPIDVYPTVVNFVGTPLVEVDLSYEDPAHGLQYEETLVFTTKDSQKVRFAVREGSPRTYKVAVTYYLSDGRVVERPPVTLDRSKFIIPQYVAAP